MLKERVGILRKPPPYECRITHWDTVNVKLQHIYCRMALYTTPNPTTLCLISNAAGCLVLYKTYVSPCSQMLQMIVYNYIPSTSFMKQQLDRKKKRQNEIVRIALQYWIDNETLFTNCLHQQNKISSAFGGFMYIVVMQHNSHY